MIRAKEITNGNNDDDPYDYSTGAIRSAGRFEQQFGKFEIRCQLPAQQGWWVAIHHLCKVRLIVPDKTTNDFCQLTDNLYQWYKF